MNKAALNLKWLKAIVRNVYAKLIQTFSYEKLSRALRVLYIVLCSYPLFIIYVVHIFLYVCTENFI